MRIDLVFIGIGLMVLVCGMAFGMWMGATANFQYANVHAHLNLVGFVVPTLYGLTHRAYPKLTQSRLALPQCIAHFVGALIFVPGLLIVDLTGNPLVVSTGAAVLVLATLTYGYVFFTADKSN